MANIIKNTMGIILAFFGTSYENSLEPIIKIHRKTIDSFPKVPVKLAFTSHIVRKIWQKRREDKEYLMKNPNLPKEILNIRGILGAISDFQEEGMEYILIQPVHMVSGEEYSDLSSYVTALNSIRTMKPKNMPFKRILLGRPIMGTYDLKNEYRRDLERLAYALKCDIEEARAQQSALVYVAHGNEYIPSGYYMEFEYVMNEKYPDVKTFVVMLEGFPGIDVVKKRLLENNISRVILVPLMVLSGDHVLNDMVGDDTNSVKSVLKNCVIDVQLKLRGLGSIDEISEIIVSNIKDLAQEL